MEAKDREMAEKEKLMEDRVTLLKEDNLMDKEEYAHQQGKLQRQLQEAQKRLEEARRRVAALESPEAPAGQLLLEHTKALPEEDDTRDLGVQEWRWRAEAAEKRSQEAAAETLILGRQLHEARQAEVEMQKSQQRSQQQCLELQQWIDRASAGISWDSNGVDMAAQAESERAGLPSATTAMLPATSAQEEAADRAASSEFSTRKPIAHHSSSQSGQNAKGKLLASVTL
ncbi:hypothetical protein CYMTET_22826 [Cymbomonas tetramitiformis]|uniref:Uncharacterized protein n=1 Tax=Cymbomonas tetramitiformis TaxID=36881 RepID=A0AAE0L1J8_9CHLO|nr:hypothetical protein CYMTET_22826 [Cymbomonas tetramitiformis]